MRGFLYGSQDFCWENTEHFHHRLLSQVFRVTLGVACGTISKIVASNVFLSARKTDNP